ILELRHDELSTHGIGKDRSAEEWKLLGRSLLHQGLVDETTDGYPVLQLNAASWQVLRKQLTVQIAVPEQLQGAAAADTVSDEAATLLKRLRSLRKRLADRQGVPPYIVFTESTLRQMAQRMPRSLSKISRISGVGSRKLDQYGQVFVDEINAFCEENGVGAQSESVPGARPVVNNTRALTLQLYEEGHSVAEIARLRSLRPTTIIGHLAALIEAGTAVDLSPVVSADRQTTIRQVLEQAESFHLSDLRDCLGEDYSYDEIRLVRGVFQWEQRSQSAS
ncbi:MAG: helix-turn-helix domain-containing protein, partial [Cyanobacteria bacterium P01_D01_bin.115]